MSAQVASPVPATEISAPALTSAVSIPVPEPITQSIPILLPAASSLYVGDLAQEISETDLFNHFSPVGTVALVRVCRDATRRKSLGYAYVNFLTSQEAERALTQLNGTLIKGRPCRVLWSQRDASIRKSGVGNVFIKNLPKNVDLKTLNDLFAPYGKITSSKIAYDHHLRSLGHAFVNFTTQEEADAAIAALNNITYQDKQLVVVKFIPKSERVFPDTPIVPVQAAPLPNLSSPPAAIFQKPIESFTNIFIKNLSAEVTEDNLKEYFGKYGEIESAFVARYLDGSGSFSGKPKGFGFVNFQRHEDALTALEASNNKPFFEGGKVLILSRYMKKSERDAQKFKNPQPHRHNRHHHNNQHHNNHRQHHRQPRNNNNINHINHNMNHNFNHNNISNIGQNQGLQQPQQQPHRHFYHNNRNNNVQPGVPQHHQGARAHHNIRRHNHQQQGINLYVKGFDSTVDEQQLKEFFNSSGTVLGTRVMKDENGASRGFGFVTLKTAEEAQKAIADTNGKRLTAAQITVAIAHHKDHNQARRHGNHRNNGKRHFKRNNQQKQVVIEQHENFIKEKIYFQLKNINPELAGQITGMIIEEYATKGLSLQELVNNDALLKEKYTQALEVLNAATAAIEPVEAPEDASANSATKATSADATEVVNAPEDASAKIEAEAKAAEDKAAEDKAAETKAAETKAAETKAAETKAAETKAAETKAAETKAETDPATATETVTETPATETPATETPAAETVPEATSVPEEKTPAAVVEEKTQ